MHAARSTQLQNLNPQPHLTPEEASITRRQPSTQQEAAEVEAWVAARKRQWPSDATMQRKADEAAARAARGIECAQTTKQQTLHCVCLQGKQHRHQASWPCDRSWQRYCRGSGSLVLMALLVLQTCTPPRVVVDVAVADMPGVVGVVGGVVGVVGGELMRPAPTSGLPLGPGPNARHCCSDCMPRTPCAGCKLCVFNNFPCMYILPGVLIATSCRAFDSSGSIRFLVVMHQTSLQRHEMHSCASTFI